MKTNKGEVHFNGWLIMWDGAVTDRFVWRVCVCLCLCGVRSGSQHATHYEPTKFPHILKYQFKLITRKHFCGAHRGGFSLTLLNWYLAWMVNSRWAHIHGDDAHAYICDESFWFLYPILSAWARTLARDLCAFRIFLYLFKLIFCHPISCGCI